jgi:membrane associated rhomboid family serine protease
MGGLTWSLIIVNVLIFEFIFSMPIELKDSIFHNFSFSTEHQFELWRWVASLFLHANASHLFLNMIGLYFFGKALEEYVTPKQWLGIYFISGIVGNLTFSLVDVGKVIGASGSVFGLMGATMLLKPTKMIKRFIIPLPLGIIAIIYTITETLLSFTPLGLETGIAHFAHIGGLITGAICAFLCDFKQAFKGVFILIFFLCLLLFSGSIILFVVEIGELIFGVVDKIVGFFLYKIASLLSWVWV